jgi:hypothetical protein
MPKFILILDHILVISMIVAKHTIIFDHYANTKEATTATLVHKKCLNHLPLPLLLLFLLLLLLIPPLPLLFQFQCRL